jgi:hypothetical protein
MFELIGTRDCGDQKTEKIIIIIEMTLFNCLDGLFKAIVLMLTINAKH